MVRPPQTNAMITIMVIQVAVVMGPFPFDFAVAFWVEPRRCGRTGRDGRLPAARPFRGRK